MRRALWVLFVKVAAAQQCMQWVPSSSRGVYPWLLGGIDAPIIKHVFTLVRFASHFKLDALNDFSSDGQKLTKKLPTKSFTIFLLDQ